jgi:hypothetical protein
MEYDSFMTREERFGSKHLRRFVEVTTLAAVHIRGNDAPAIDMAGDRRS